MNFQEENENIKNDIEINLLHSEPTAWRQSWTWPVTAWR